MSKRTDMPPGLKKLEEMERQVKRDRPSQSVTCTMEIGALVADVRRVLGVRQVDLAARARVGRHWLMALEQGKQSCEVELVLRTLETLGLEMVLTPYVPVPPWITVAQHAAETRRRQTRIRRNQKRTGQRALERSSRLHANAPRVEVDLE